MDMIILPLITSLTFQNLLQPNPSLRSTGQRTPPYHQYLWRCLYVTKECHFTEEDCVTFVCLHRPSISLPSRVFPGNLKNLPFFSQFPCLQPHPPSSPRQYSVSLQEYAWLVIPFGKTRLPFFSILSEPSIHAFRGGPSTAHSTADLLPTPSSSCTI